MALTSHTRTLYTEAEREHFITGLPQGLELWALPDDMRHWVATPAALRPNPVRVYRTSSKPLQQCPTLATYLGHALPGV